MRRNKPVYEPLPPTLLATALEMAGDPILITSPGLDSPEPTILFVNAAFETLTGYTREELIGQSPRMLQGPSTQRSTLDQMKKALADTGTFLGETVNYRKDGSEYTVEWRVNGVKNELGETTHWISIQRELSERQHQQTALRQANEKLEARMKARTSALQEANDELTGFIYTVSHDFRAPLRAIMSASYVLIEDYGDRIDADGKAELQRQSNAAKKLGVLMDDLLKISRLARQEMVRETVDLTSIARDIASDILMRRNPEECDITVYDDLTADGDPRLLRLLLQNLLENSVKFAKKDGTVSIVVGKEGDRFFVRDNGIGFKPEYAQKIFLPFERLHSESEYSGNGVGLANVKRIVDKHGGRITAEGEPDEGATFWFTLGE